MSRVAAVPVPDDSSTRDGRPPPRRSRTCRSPAPTTARGACGRARNCARGAGGLNDAELYALVLGSGVAGRSAVRLGARSARAPAELVQWPLTRWLALAGIGPARASRCARRSSWGAARRSGSPGTAIRGAGRRAAACAISPPSGASTSWCCCSTRGTRCSAAVISIGSLNASIVHPAQKCSCRRSSSRRRAWCSCTTIRAAIPSRAKRTLSITRRLVEVGDLVGIGVLDHVVVASRGLVSFRARRVDLGQGPRPLAGWCRPVARRANDEGGGACAPPFRREAVPRAIRPCGR